MINVFIGYDPRESFAYHVLSQSILDTCSVPVSLVPLHSRMLENFDGQQDGTNAFIYSRFLVPDLMGFEGLAIYLDSDMLVRADLAELQFDGSAVQVVKHDYKTKHYMKAIGTALEAKNEDYPRKNWSSMVLWNCGHPQNRILTREFVSEAGGRMLHRFEWLTDDLIGSLGIEWNHLVGEYARNPNAKIAHYTLGIPAFRHYRNSEFSTEWRATAEKVVRADEVSISRYA